jgi:hypothetical protein
LRAELAKLNAQPLDTPHARMTRAIVVRIILARKEG